MRDPSRQDANHRGREPWRDEPGYRPCTPGFRKRRTKGVAVSGGVAFLVIGLVALALAFSAFIVVLRRSASRSPVVTDLTQATEASRAEAAQTAERDADQLRDRATADAEQVRTRAQAEAEGILRRATEAAEQVAQGRREVEDEIRAVKDEMRELRSDLERRAVRIGEREQRLDDESRRLEERRQGHGGWPGCSRVRGTRRGWPSASSGKPWRPKVRMGRQGRSRTSTIPTRSQSEVGSFRKVNFGLHKDS